MTWLQDAYDAGARIVVNAPVEKVLIEGGEAKGVEATTADGHRLTVRARAVAAAAGAINTPALLVRSGLDNPNVGKNLMIHPVLLVWAMFDEEVLPWTGVFGSTFCDEFLDMGEGYGVKYMHASAHPSDLAVFAPWRGASEHAELMQSLRYTGGFGALQRARDAGEVVVGKDGVPTPVWSLSDFDRDVMRKGLDGMSQILEAGGARRIYTIARRLDLLRPGQRRARADAEGGRRLRLGRRAGHPRLVPPDGHRPHGHRRQTTVCDPTGEAWNAKNLFVVDGAVLPTALGVNPMITIEAAAHRIARGMAAKLT